ncbi:reticulocyte-binding protein homolog 2a isoform X2 [Pectinophora gossypiella]|uniref:reticulocyte-binding protein homolog 2a isoform X2 n=1 Tax=Pectinophora gossypiella TaxID=13191 RepID=UPI00214E0F19|nr:reticulocyte-binding protein homolog 2a isoform X2 [Pectinophora gossypiella]
MEEIILNKNIFHEKDLAKLSPDYTPPNTLVRLQMRSTMVKDTHAHKLKSDTWERKTIKRSKDCYKVNKEIAKIRNGFKTLNLKNQIMMKNAVKFIDTLKSEDFGNTYDEEFDNTLGHDAEAYLQEVSENHVSLVVQNDSDFKVKEKLKTTKVNNVSNNNKKENKTVVQLFNERNKQINDEFDIENFLKIECTFHKPELKTEGTVNNENIVDTNDPEYTLDLSTSRKEIEPEVEELKSLLIMMALTPASNEKDGVVANRSLSDNIYLQNYTTKGISNHVAPVVNTEMHLQDAGNCFNVIPLKIQINERQKVLAKKYVGKWKDAVLRKKEANFQQRAEILNKFLDKLAKKKVDMNEPQESVNKAKLLARDFNKYRHRYLVQKHVIALQKAKLEEQNRIIEELKYNRIVEATRHSVDAMREEVRKTYYDMDKQLKPKIKCLTNDLKIDVEEPSLVLQCLKVPQFLQRMEKRAREREEKHAMIRERRQQMEEDRIRLKQQEELAKAQMDKEEKMKRMKELRDKRKREKIDGIRKKQHTERMRALAVMAQLHYEKSLLAKYGVRPFRILIEIKRDNIEKSRAHYRFQLKKNVFLHWMWHTEDMWFDRNYKAEDFYRKKVLRRAFNALKQHYHNYVLKKQVAEDYYDLFVTNLVFKKFRRAINIVKEENERKFRKAVMYHNCDILFKTFTCWRSLPALNTLRREQEARKARWREKVLQVVPDYLPPED